MVSDIRQEMVALLPRLRRFAYALTGSPDEADDLVQTVCERALARLSQFEPGTRLDSWLFRIAQNTWIDRMRSRRRHSTISDPELIDAQPFDARIEERVEAKDALAIVRAETARLPEEQRLLLSMVVVEGLSYRDAAEALGIPIGTVMSRLARMRRKLGEALENPRQPVPRGETP